MCNSNTELNEISDYEDDFDDDTHDAVYNVDNTISTVLIGRQTQF